MKEMLLVVASLAIAACGASTKKSTNGPTSTAAAGPVFAQLFESGKSWTFQLSLNLTPPIDMGPPSTTSHGQMVCTVESVKEIGTVKLSKIACTAEQEHAPGASDAPVGYWATDGKGLWHFDASVEPVYAELASKLVAKEMLLAATPVAFRTETTDDEGALSLYETKAGQAGVWCTSYVYAMGDEGGFEMCLKAGTGIVSGNWFSAGATTYEHAYK